MNVYNNTSDVLAYEIVASSGGHDGQVQPGETAEEPSFDNNEWVRATFWNSSTGGDSLSLTIPETKEGMAVTIGIYFE